MLFDNFNLDFHAFDLASFSLCNNEEDTLAAANKNIAVFVLQTVSKRRMIRSI
jgi:hypothetical protein